MMLELDIQNPEGFLTIPSESEFQAGVIAALQEDFCSDSGCSVVIRIVDESEGTELNNHYRQKNAPTNVLSFPFEMPDLSGFEGVSETMSETMEEPRHLGDLVFCLPLVEKEAVEQRKTLKQHWMHLLVHGMLHLQGYDHVEDEEAELMEALEINILQRLGISNPYELGMIIE